MISRGVEIGTRAERERQSIWRRFASAMGPGRVFMLADTKAGGATTAAARVADVLQAPIAPCP